MLQPKSPPMAGNSDPTNSALPPSAARFAFREKTSHDFTPFDDAGLAALGLDNAFLCTDGPPDLESFGHAEDAIRQFGESLTLQDAFDEQSQNFDIADSPSKQPREPHNSSSIHETGILHQLIREKLHRSEYTDSYNHDRPYSSCGQTTVRTETASLHSCDWTDEDEDDSLKDLLDDGLGKMRSGTVTCMTTGPLSHKQRQAVKSCAHLYRLNHVYLGDRGNRRMAMSMYTIAPVNGASRPHNRRGLPYPKIIMNALTFDNIGPDPTGQELWDAIVARQLPSPKAFACDQEEGKAYCTAWAEFTSAEEAAEVHAGLNGQCLTEGSGPRLEVGFQLQVEPETIVVERRPGAASEGPSTLGNPLAIMSPHGIAIALETYLGVDSARHGPSPRSVSSSFEPSSDGAGAIFTDSDYASGASATKKRKREPRIEGGYSCLYPGCGKTFDISSALTKHQVVHKPDADLVYRCQACQRGFQSNRDLRRHCTKKHASASLSSSLG